MKKQFKIIIGGDLGPTESNYIHFSESNLKALINEELFDLLFSADYKIFNLELPLSDKKNPVSKDGPNLIAPGSTVNGIKLLNPLVLSLANNHIMDHDEQGFFDTLNHLSNNGILSVGAGKNLNEASKPLIIEMYGIKTGIYSCAENEFSIAKNDRAGANPFDPLESLDHIRDLKRRCNFVVILYHGGKECYRYPSPYLQRVCRKMAEKGGDLIICQHSHCIGSFEHYNDSIIVYGQGNFLFDRREDEFWNTSLLIRASFGEKISVEFIPVCKKGNGVELPSKEISKTIMANFNKRSDQIKTPGFVEAEFERFCIKNGQYYLATTAGFGKVLRNIDKILKGSISRKIYSLKKLNSLQNNIECESNRELLLRFITVIKKSKKSN